MATTPSTLVVFTEDKINFPIKTAMVVMKQLFQYGVKELAAKGDKIFISLSYSPRAATLKRKFGNLPVRYMRAKLEKEEDFKLLERVVKKYRFNLLAEQLEDVDRRHIEGSNKRKLYLEPSTSLEEWTEEDLVAERAIEELLSLHKKPNTNTTTTTTPNSNTKEDEDDEDIQCTQVLT